MRICPLDHELQETSYTRSKLDCDHPSRGKAYHAAICTLTCPQCDYDECLNEHVLATAGGPSDNRRSCNATSEAPQEAAPKPPPTPQERIAALEAENAKLQSTIKALRASGPGGFRLRLRAGVLAGIELPHAGAQLPPAGDELRRCRAGRWMMRCCARALMKRRCTLLAAGAAGAAAASARADC